MNRRISSGLWGIRNLASGFTTNAVFGGNGYLPVAGDYNGDGMADACVCDEATGNWYIVAIDGTRVAWPVQHGGYGFMPVKP